MGLVLLGVFISYVIITIVVLVIVVKVIPSKKWKWISGIVVVLASVLIPTWDIPIGRINFNHLCETQAGQFIYKQIPLGEEYFLKPGERDLRYQHDSHPSAYAKGGELNMGKIKQEYMINTKLDRDYSRWGHIYKWETIISTVQSNEILSRAVSFHYRGGWLGSRLMFGRAGREVCPENALPGIKEYIHVTIVNKTFQRGVRQ